MPTHPTPASAPSPTSSPSPESSGSPTSSPNPASTPAPGSAEARADATRRPVRRALLSVYDKTGLVDLARALHAAGVEMVSTGSTAATIAGAGLPVTRVEDLTGFPECLDGRVKTLHPRVHAGILADTRRPEHLAQLAGLDVAPFELVVVNLYPFTATVASGAGPDECVEQIDIGGPSMVRAAAKNHPSVAVVVDPARYDEVVAAVAAGGFTLAQRRALAAAAFVHTATYDVAVASWMGSVVAPTDEVDGVATGFPAWVGATWERAAVLRYGENPHQRAALYTAGGRGVGGSGGAGGAGDAEGARGAGGAGGLASATQLHGKEMSYNNYVDADAAWRAAHDHDAPAVAIVKHANPCGIAVGADVAAAHAKAHACDPVSAFGGVIATNRPVTAAMAEQVAEVFTEVVVAPAFEPEALAVLTAKKSLRLLVVGDGGVGTGTAASTATAAGTATGAEAGAGAAGTTGGDGAVAGGAARRGGGVELRPISGGLLLQSTDRLDAPGDDPGSWRLVAGDPADAATLADLAFAWRAVRAVKSNAILLAHDGASVGVGMGQVNRVDSCRLAVERANAGGAERARGAVAASDAFFPFADGLGVLVDAGVRAVVQPGGSVRDAEVVEAAQAAGITMYLTGTRHFWH